MRRTSKAHARGHFAKKFYSPRGIESWKSCDMLASVRRTSKRKWNDALETGRYFHVRQQGKGGMAAFILIFCMILMTIGDTVI